MKNKIIISFGRMSPPTFSGHGLLVKKVMQVADDAKADHLIVLQRTQDKKKNPLPVERKVYWAKKMFPSANIIAATSQMRTIIEVAKALTGKYKHLVVVGGQDRVDEFKTLLNKYNGDVFNFEQIDVISAGDRDPDSDGAAGMSATKMRNAAVQGDMRTFKMGAPPNFKDSDINLLMKEIKSGLGINEGVSYYDFIKTLGINTIPNH